EEQAEPEAPPLSEQHEPIVAVLREALGDGVIDAVTNHGRLVVRVANEAWVQAAEVARDRLDCEYLSFISGIDWQPRDLPPTEDPSAPSIPVQPDEVTYGVTGSAGRFQVFACVESTERHREIILKADVDEANPRIGSWVPVFAGADWHERECWEMFGIVFDGHPSLRHLYLPSEFEGHPLRKDFPLLAREVKPWPGLVDVETMPDDLAADDSAEGATVGAEGGDESA
ncbi:MAG TPA: NADH-quinone oxidoreductase subunit C, partial [Acidimicrobiia bacterium]|nr:NADH-quinone oxidoreductase subunit C [Acidimicrobiia bacterium]